MIEQQLNKILQEIDKLYKAHRTNSKSITLLAVSKRHPARRIREAFSYGQRHFGENYLNEALEKQIQLSDLAIVWHYIGSIQSNKTKKIAENFTWVHTVDSLKIATRLSNQRPKSLLPLNICLQINIDVEVSKSGLSPNKDLLLQLATEIQALPNVTLRGLMCIPAPKSSKVQERETFRRMQYLLDYLNSKGLLLDTLSMGMSNDLDTAIECGATVVRVGTAIFGQRT